MSSNFPTGLDSYVNPTSADHLGDGPVLHSAQHSNLNDAVENIETKIGIDFSNVVNSLDFITKLLLMTFAQHPQGGYRETSYVSNTFPIVDTISWYADSGKTVKLMEKTYTYGSIRVLPTTVILKIYDGTVSNVLKRTITDTITYNRVFEISRARIIT